MSAAATRPSSAAPVAGAEDRGGEKQAPKSSRPIRRSHRRRRRCRSANGRRPGRGGGRGVHEPAGQSALPATHRLYIARKTRPSAPCRPDPRLPRRRARTRPSWRRAGPPASPSAGTCCVGRAPHESRATPPRSRRPCVRAGPSLRCAAGLLGRGRALTPGSPGRPCRTAAAPRGTGGHPPPQRAGRCDRRSAAVSGSLHQPEERREILPRGHRGAENGEVLPPDPVEAGRGIGPARRAAHRDPAACAATDSDVFHVASPMCSTTTSIPWPPVAALTSLATSAVAWFTAASAPSARARSSFSSDPEVTTTRAPSAFASTKGRRADPAADPPARDPLVLAQPGPRYEHAVRRLVHEGEGGRLEQVEVGG